VDRSHHPYAENLRLTQMSTCSAKTTKRMDRYFRLFLTSLGVTVGYYFFKAGIYVVEEDDLPFFLLILLILIAITGLFFIWWSVQYINCSPLSTDDDDFDEGIKHLKNGYLALAGISSIAIINFLYNHFKHFFNDFFLKTTGFSLGGKRKLKR
jgi:hypothetical protein